jgi:hypothetical protein
MEKLARYTQFVMLIEQGATKDEACAAVLEQQDHAAPAEQKTSCDAPAERSAEEMASAEEEADHRPRLEGQTLRRALFATLAQLFTNGDPRHVELERGKFNRAIKNFVLVGLQPDDVLAVKAAFEHLWPRATCTALGLANNLPLLIGTAEGMGLYLQATEVTP